MNEFINIVIKLKLDSCVFKFEKIYLSSTELF